MVPNLPFWLAAIACVAIDQVTKSLAVTYLQPHGAWLLWSGVFHLTYVTNTGGAFSLFKNSVDWLKWVSLVVSLGLGIFGWFATRLDRWEQVGYGCILGGALGNGIDRFSRGYVVDFLDFHLTKFPVFNIADMAINIGLGCLIVAVWRGMRKP